ncbi:hypothetical protein Q4610_07950 [Sphingobium sp. HBC34]|uniref:Uncharacterized protein n=1 Tax=Sphingobium cyanobacteriorum TaxID=3063954 RepID=A0ABT8ZKC0_9SPHN|nr:hypothetical protein [Sphingobium sp. HBC34]MDO7834980.1 hypothetical protein [Sphingobium sp. HBC34]
MNAKERVNRNPVNPQYGVQVEGNPAFPSKDMVNVPLWHDLAGSSKQRLFVAPGCMDAADSVEILDPGQSISARSAPGR